MNLDELKQLREQITNDPDQVTDEQLSDAVTAIREQVTEAKKAGVSPELIATLEDLKGIRDSVIAIQGGRAEASAKVNAEAERLLADFDEPETPAEPVADSNVDTAAEGDAPAEQTPELVTAGGAVVDQLAERLLARIDSAFASRSAATPAAAKAPQGRTGRPAQTAPPVSAGDVATSKVYLGSHSEQGRPVTSELEIARAVHEKWRGAYQAKTKGRMPVLTVDTAYPDSRVLGQNAEVNFEKIRAVTSPQSLTAAGGLCAPLENLYDVEVIGSAARPVRDALGRFSVERGGISFRPNTSAAAAVYGAGVWTMTDDAADPLGTKACYVVDCPGLTDEVVEAIYLCLEFSNISTRFDPEVTASNVQQGLIAHARLAENRLLAKLAAGSKILSAPKVVGATRDILANLDKATAYYRNRHRIEDSVALTFVLPGWVRSLMRADIARQMAAGDWMEALALADSSIDGWFSRRNVSVVWHLDGPAGLDEVQTVTITGTPTGGTFTLTYSGQTTAAIAYNATAATVEAALANLSNLRAEDIVVAGGPGPGTAYTVTFNGGVTDGANVAQMTASAAGLTGGTSPAVTVTTTTGGGGALTVNGVSIASQTYPDAAAGGVLPGFPDQIDSLLFPSGSWLFLDGGSLDLGLVRDSELNSRNRYRQFSETFEGAAFRGVESLRLAMTVQPTGQTSGTKDTTAADAIAD
jgi:molybdenum-dependent DNA-binding transcriptional regulator ModE